MTPASSSTLLLERTASKATKEKPGPELKQSCARMLSRRSDPVRGKRSAKLWAVVAQPLTPDIMQAAMGRCRFV